MYCTHVQCTLFKNYAAEIRYANEKLVDSKSRSVNKVKHLAEYSLICKVQFLYVYYNAFLLVQISIIIFVCQCS